MEISTENVKPRQIRNAGYFLWTCLFLGFVLRTIDGNSFSPALVEAFFSSGQFLSFAIYAYLIVGISKGRKSARMLLLAFFVGGLLLAPPTFSALRDYSLIGAIEATQLCLQVVALVWLFTAPGKGWFAAPKVAQASSET